MSYKLKSLGTYSAGFNTKGGTIRRWYRIWVITLDGSDLYRWAVTENCNLSYFLIKLLGHKEELDINESNLIIFRTMFDHSNYWKSFSDARSILDKRGPKRALEFLLDKFAKVALADKLKVGNSK